MTFYILDHGPPTCVITGSDPPGWKAITRERYEAVDALPAWYAGKPLATRPTMRGAEELVELLINQEKERAMSADNYVHIKRFFDGFYWANFSASCPPKRYLRRMFTSGPHATALAAWQNADLSLCVIEYGIQFDANCPPAVSGAPK